MQASGPETGADVLRGRRARTLSACSLAVAIAWWPVNLMWIVFSFNSIPMYGHQDLSLVGTANALMVATVIVPMVGLGLAAAGRSQQPHLRAAVCLWLNGVWLALACIKFLPT